MTRILIFILYSLSLNSSAFGAGNALDARKWTIAVGMMQAPWPSLVSVSVEYFWKPWSSIGVSYGMGVDDAFLQTPMQSVGLALGLYPPVNFFPFLRKWRLSPAGRLIVQNTFGASQETFSLVADSPIGAYEMNQLSSGINLSYDAGVEWRFAQKKKYRLVVGYGSLLMNASGGAPFLRFSVSF